MNNYALVTGASKGIGKSISVVLARAGYNLLLVSRSEQELRELAAQLEHDHQVKVSYLAADLTAPGAAAEVARWSAAQTPAVSILINNAGYGLYGHFADTSLAALSNMLQLNINAVLELTHLLLPQLKLQPQAYVLNLASTAAYQSVPSLTVYAATKAFILSYSRGLRYELLGSTVSVSCLCPGPTDTGFANRAGLDAFADLAEKFNMSPDEVARVGIRGMFSKKAEIIPGFLNALSAFGVRLLPKSLIEKVSASLYSR